MTNNYKIIHISHMHSLYMCVCLHHSETNDRSLVLSDDNVSSSFSRFVICRCMYRSQGFIQIKVLGQCQKKIKICHGYWWGGGSLPKQIVVNSDKVMLHDITHDTLGFYIHDI